MSELHNYSMDKQRAIEQMLDMNKRATKDSVNSNNQTKHPHTQRSNGEFTLPFMNLPLDSDSITILTLMLILYTNSSDMVLIFALAYILI